MPYLKTNVSKLKLTLYDAPYFLSRLVIALLFSYLTACGGGDDDDEPSPGPGSTNPPPTQNAPQAAIDSQLNYKVGDTVMLDATRSTVDSGQTIQSYTWNLTTPDGSDSTLTSSTPSVMASFSPDMAGAYQVSLVVSDGQLNSDPTTVTIQVTAIGDNGLPNAMITAGTSGGAVGIPFIFSGSSSSDPDQGSDGLTFTWTLDAPDGSAATLNFVDDANINGSFTPDIAGSYTLSLMVTDSQQANSITISITITVLDQPAMTAEAVINVGTTFTVNDTVNIDGSGSTVPDGASFVWSLVTFPGDTAPTINNAGQSNPSFVPVNAGVYVLNLSIVDAQMTELASTQKMINVITADDTPGPVDQIDVELLEDPQTLGCFQDNVDVTLNDDGSFDVALLQDVTVSSDDDVPVQACILRLSLSVPDGIRLATTQASAVGSETDKTVFVLKQAALQSPGPATYLRLYFPGVDGPFQADTTPYDLTYAESPCGGPVTLATLVTLAAFNDANGVITLSAGNSPPVLSISNTFEACDY
jgi:K319L-like, PKD domain